MLRFIAGSPMRLVVSGGGVDISKGVDECSGSSRARRCGSPFPAVASTSHVVFCAECSRVVVPGSAAGVFSGFVPARGRVGFFRAW